MKVSTLLAAAGAIVTLSAGAALAAEACVCCKDMAAESPMSCCPKPESAAPAPAPAPTPTPPPAPSDSAPATPSHQH